jgi:Mg2+ and Co2+ transporter CorA
MDNITTDEYEVHKIENKKIYQIVYAHHHIEKYSTEKIFGISEDAIEESLKFFARNRLEIYKDVMKDQIRQFDIMKQKRVNALERLNTLCEQCENGVYEPALEYPQDFNSMETPEFTMIQCSECPNELFYD